MSGIPYSEIVSANGDVLPFIRRPAERTISHVALLDEPHGEYRGNVLLILVNRKLQFRIAVELLWFYSIPELPGVGRVFEYLAEKAFSGVQRDAWEDFLVEYRADAEKFHKRGRELRLSILVGRTDRLEVVGLPDGVRLELSGLERTDPS